MKCAFAITDYSFIGQKNGSLVFSSKTVELIEFYDYLISAV